MQEFDKQSFESSMSEAIHQQGLGNHEEALRIREYLHITAPEYSSEQGRAARDCAVSCDLLGYPDEAEEWADEAYDIHDTLVRAARYPSPEAYRDRAETAKYIGVRRLRDVIRGHKAPTSVDARQARSVLRQSLHDVQAANHVALTPGTHAEREINDAARLVSLAESLAGDRAAGFRIGSRAVRLALRSESPSVETTDSRQYMKTKHSALASGMAAVAVSALATSKPSLRQRMAFRIANKAL